MAEQQQQPVSQPHLQNISQKKKNYAKRKKGKKRNLALAKLEEIYYIHPPPSFDSSKHKKKKWVVCISSWTERTENICPIDVCSNLKKRTWDGWKRMLCMSVDVLFSYSFLTCWLVVDGCCFLNKLHLSSFNFQLFFIPDDNTVADGGWTERWTERKQQITLNQTE